MERVESARRLPPIGSLIRHQRNVILSSIAIAIGLGLIYVVSLPSTYTATSAVLLSPSPGNPLTAEAASAGVVQMTVALETEAQMMRTPAVAEVVGDQLDRVTPDSGERLAVTVPSNTQMLEISFTADDPERAMAGAQGFAEGYLSFRAERSSAVQEARITRLEEQVAETDAALRTAISEAEAAGGSVYESQQVQLLADRLAQLSNALSTEQAISTDPGAVVNDAALPDSSNELPAWLYLGAAVVLGAVVGLGIGLLREWRRDLLRESDDAADLGVPVLAAIRLLGEPALAVSSHSSVHESYRRLRTAVIANGPRPYVLAVTGVDTDLSAEVATNLALVMAEAKFSVLLISTDSQERAVEALLDIRGEGGLAEVVLNGVAPEDLLIHTHGISVLTSGVEVEHSDDLTATSAFRSVVSELHAEFDYVIVAAALAGTADGDAALLAVDSALLVLAPGATSRTLLTATLERFERLGVDTIGAVNVARTAVRGATAPVGADDGSSDEGDDGAHERADSVGGSDAPSSVDQDGSAGVRGGLDSRPFSHDAETEVEDGEARGDVALERAAAAKDGGRVHVKRFD